MKILIDHGVWHNLGDIAMVRGALHRYAQKDDRDFECYVVDRETFPDEIWSLAQT